MPFMVKVENEVYLVVAVLYSKGAGDTFKAVKMAADQNFIGGKFTDLDPDKCEFLGFNSTPVIIDMLPVQGAPPRILRPM